MFASRQHTANAGKSATPSGSCRRLDTSTHSLPPKSMLRTYNSHMEISVVSSQPQKHFWINVIFRLTGACSGKYCTDRDLLDNPSKNETRLYQKVLTRYTWHYIFTVRRCGDGGGGNWLVQMKRCPTRWSVCLPLLISLAPQSPEVLFWHRLTWVVPEKGP